MRKLLYNVFIYFESKVNKKYICCHNCCGYIDKSCNQCLTGLEKDNDFLYRWFGNVRKKFFM